MTPDDRESVSERAQSDSAPCAASTSDEGRRRVSRYYDETQVLYTRIWSRTGVHYGLWDEETKGRPEAIRNLDRFVATELDLPRGSRVLDAGCGIGGTTLFLASEFGFDMSGITLSDYQLKCAERSARSAKTDLPPSYSICDYLDTGFPSQSFDGVIALESACYAESTPRLLGEILRILRPGGRLVVADGFRGTVRPGDRKRYDRMLRGMALTDLLSPSEFEQDLEDAGYDNIRVYDKQNAVMPSAQAIERLSWIGFAICALPCALGIFPRGWFHHGLAGIAQRQLFERDAVNYRIFSARKAER